ncbi:hypothetical protein [Thermomonospora amylolytica]|uniref:hypothetical protein n=1 Tax=Thermomonospora amylolytica TaxID=1411117 RepID=UPI0013005AF6|nr:hypothetical protein [Thermomonospora amylolytica]
MTDQPFDMRTAAVYAHEQYTSLTTAGFTPGQALYLVAAILTGGPKPPTDHDHPES